MEQFAQIIAGFVLTLTLIAGLLLLAKWLSRLQEKPVSRTREWLFEHRQLLESLVPVKERAFHTRFKLYFQIPILTLALAIAALHFCNLRQIGRLTEAYGFPMMLIAVVGIACVNLRWFTRTRHRITDVLFHPPESWLTRRRPVLVTNGILVILVAVMLIERHPGFRLHWLLGICAFAFTISEALLPGGPRVCEDGLYTGWRFLTWEAITWYRWLDNREAIVFGYGGKSINQLYEILPVPQDQADRLVEFFDAKMAGKQLDEIPLTN